MHKKQQTINYNDNYPQLSQPNSCFSYNFNGINKKLTLTWNSLPEYMTVDTLTLDYFKWLLKCFLSARYWHSAWSALGICNDSTLYKCTLNNNNNN